MKARFVKHDLSSRLSVFTLLSPISKTVISGKCTVKFYWILPDSRILSLYYCMYTVLCIQVLFVLFFITSKTVYISSFLLWFLAVLPCIGNRSRTRHSMLWISRQPKMDVVCIFWKILRYTVLHKTFLRWLTAESYNPNGKLMFWTKAFCQYFVFICATT